MVRVKPLAHSRFAAKSSIICHHKCPDSAYFLDRAAASPFINAAHHRVSQASNAASFSDDGGKTNDPPGCNSLRNAEAPAQRIALLPSSHPTLFVHERFPS